MTIFQCFFIRFVALLCCLHITGYCSRLLFSFSFMSFDFNYHFMSIFSLSLANLIPWRMLQLYLCRDTNLSPSAAKFWLVSNADI